MIIRSSAQSVAAVSKARHAMHHQRVDLLRPKNNRLRAKSSFRDLQLLLSRPIFPNRLVKKSVRSTLVQFEQV